ncbi:unnamed protein product [Protopolystoma xenopodis]|uniref:Uncharacterized protein n=1 Tax=Protopolystoma xenopodis TaxID=117903 RepID=A0A448WDZ9_9PLAT|nr:unnamed protein product [Protopolystoma xenopodis]
MLSTRSESAPCKAVRFSENPPLKNSPPFRAQTLVKPADAATQSAENVEQPIHSTLSGIIPLGMRQYSMYTEAGRNTSMPVAVQTSPEEPISPHKYECMQLLPQISVYAFLAAVCFVWMQLSHPQGQTKYPPSPTSCLPTSSCLPEASSAHEAFVSAAAVTPIIDPQSEIQTTPLVDVARLRPNVQIDSLNTSSVIVFGSRID